MPRIAGPLLACALALANTPADAQAGATPAPPEDGDASTAGEPRGGSAQVPTADDICRALEQSAAENALPVEFFARVIWQESRFDAQAVSPKGAAGIAQFMPATASWHGLADPFDPVRRCGIRLLIYENYSTDLATLDLQQRRTMQVQAESAPGSQAIVALPAETRNYVALVTGWTADEWASSSPPEKAETTIPQGVPCTRLANLILAPKQERQRIAAYIPRWGVPLAAHLSESTAWAIYRDRLKRFGSAHRGSRTHRPTQGNTGYGHAKRYIITLADDDRRPLDKLCRKLIAADATCDVLRNPDKMDQ